MERIVHELPKKESAICVSIPMHQVLFTFIHFKTHSTDGPKYIFGRI
jgi:hypothetical protein